jgi:hypothetical protein
VSPSAVQVKGIADATALFGGISHTCVIGKKGNVSCWGANDHGQIGDGTKENRPTPIGVKGVENAKQLALGVWHSCALDAKRAVTCWGDLGGAKGAVTALTMWNRVDEIMATQGRVCARVADKVSCLRQGETKATDIEALAKTSQLVGSFEATCGLRADRTLVCVDPFQGKVTERAKNVRTYAVGGSFECMVADDERVRCNSAHPGRAVIEAL